MPYVVTTKRPGCGWGENCPTAHPPTVSRVAVATLEEARSDARAIALDHNSIGGAQKAMRLPESGGTVGPLPDGTLIEVEFVGWSHLYPGPWHANGPTHAEIIAAFNAQQERS